MMRKKQALYKNILSIALLVILLAPRLIKITHFFYIPHVHVHLKKTSAPIVDNVYHSCHICAYKFAEIIEGESAYLAVINDFCLVDFKSYVLLSQKNENYNFLGLRAPPFSC